MISLLDFTGGEGRKGKRGRRAREALLVLLFLAFIAGCGYHVAGKAGRMPGGVTTLTIPVFENKTSKPDIEGILTGAFVEEFVTTVQVVSAGEAVMRGTINVYELNPVSFTKSDVNQEYRLTVEMNLVLSRYSDDEILWKDANVRDYEDFLVDTSNVAATKEAEKEALRKIARDTARLVKERILEDF